MDGVLVRFACHDDGCCDVSLVFFSGCCSLHHSDWDAKAWTEWKVGLLPLNKSSGDDTPLDSTVRQDHGMDMHGLGCLNEVGHERTLVRDVWRSPSWRKRAPNAVCSAYRRSFRLRTLGKHEVIFVTLPSRWKRIYFNTHIMLKWRAHFESVLNRSRALSLFSSDDADVQNELENSKWYWRIGRSNPNDISTRFSDTLLEIRRSIDGTDWVNFVGEILKLTTSEFDRARRSMKSCGMLEHSPLDERGHPSMIVSCVSEKSLASFRCWMSALKTRRWNSSEIQSQRHN